MILKEHTASLDVDAQNGFTPLCPNELPVPGGGEIVPELNLQAQKARIRIGSKDSHSSQAVWVADDEHPPLTPIEGRAVDMRWPVHCVPGTKGFELIQGLPHPMDYDFFVWKGVEPDMHPYGECFHDIEERLSTGLIEYLRANQIKTLLVGGLATEYCVKQTVLQLLTAGFNVIVNLGACQGLTPTGVTTAIEEMQAAGAQFIQSAHELDVS